MIPLGWDEMRGGIVFMYSIENLKYVTRLKQKITPPVKKLECWPEDLVVEQDYCRCFNIF